MLLSIQEIARTVVAFLKVHSWIVAAVWLPLPEAVFGRTFGKWACDLRVVDLNGRPITAGHALVRRLLDPVDLLFFFGLVGYIVAKTNPLNQRLGDLVAKTHVIEEPVAPSAA